MEEIASGLAALIALLQPRLAPGKKLQSLLAGAKKKIDKSDFWCQDLKKMVADLRKLIEPRPAASEDLQFEARVESFCSEVVAGIPAIADARKKAFWPALDEEAKKSGLRFERVGGKECLDVFEVTADASKNVASLIYAQHVAASGILMQQAAVVKRAKKLGDEIRSWVDSARPEELGQQFDEAMLVSLARGGKPMQGDQKRVALPVLFREMQFVVQDRAKPLTAETVQEYTMPQFVVNLHTLVASEWNVNSSRRFDLEPAVIENAGNIAKAVFIPDAIDAGYGEGKWWQALRRQ
ncbi:MAG: hypothetical protein NTW75_00235 [Planctomycetales bacterium]|nr:hypothetical protein [Planctomycetales bacterium]